jgi:intracellular septation protein
LLDLGPMLVFFGVNWKMGLLWATAALMAVTFISLGITYALTRSINRFALMGAIFVGVFGAITLYLQDAWYLKLKVTLVELFFAGLLLGGLWFKRMFVKDMMGELIELPDDVWRKLTIRWALFFVAMAILNVIIWQMFSESTWVTFKAFGLMGCTVVFALANAPLMSKYLKD